MKYYELFAKVHGLGNLVETFLQITVHVTQAKISRDERSPWHLSENSGFYLLWYAAYKRQCRDNDL